MIIDAPCRGCSDRTIGCHSTCKRYFEYRKRVDEIREAERRRRREEELNGGHYKRRA